MQFLWSDYLDLAEFLAGKRNELYSEEAARRSAVSRAYYSAFCLARNYAQENLGFEPAGHGRDHKALREHFKNKDRRAIANDLGRLRRWRNYCDYDDTIPQGLDRRVGEAIRVAREIENEL